MNTKSLISLSLEEKARLSKQYIREFSVYCNGNVFVSFSGGKDSVVLLHLVREALGKQIPAVFADTGMEFPEVRKFAKTVPNIHFVKPRKTYMEVINHFGYPVISKEVSRYIQDIRSPTVSERLKRLRLEGINDRGERVGVGKLPEKWKFLINAPFKISNHCCDVLKKQPLEAWAKRHNNAKAFVGLTYTESPVRKRILYSKGVNLYNQRSPKSYPLLFWSEENVWNYIRTRGLQVPSIYNYYARTGCVFCLFGIHQEPDRFERLKRTHPELYNYCMNRLGMKKVLEFLEKHGEGNL